MISDQFNKDGFPRPPEIQNQSVSLHEKAHEINGEFQHDTDKGMFDLAWELEDELSSVVEKLERILNAITDLTDLSPPLDDWVMSGMPDLDQYSRQLPTVVTFEPGTLNLEPIRLKILLCEIKYHGAQAADERQQSVQWSHIQQPR